MTADSQKDIEYLRAIGRICAETLRKMMNATRAGMTTRELDEIGRALLEAEEIGLSVLAPTAYYARYSLEEVERSFNRGVAALGLSQGVAMSFSFRVLDEQIRLDRIPAPPILLDLLDASNRLYPR